MPPSKFKQVLLDLKLIDDVEENDLVSNLLRRPIKDLKVNTPHTTATARDFAHQADTLYLPHDETLNPLKKKKKPAKKKGKKGNKATTTTTTDTKPTKQEIIYKYALVVVDLATNHMDAEAVLSKSADEATTAIERIYKRKYLSKPKLLEVDDGTEFKGVFKQHFNNNLELRVKRTGRHRAQANVEGMNSIISNLLQRIMLKESLEKNIEMGDWVKHLPTVVKLINEYFAHKPIEIDAIDEPPTCSGNSCDILAVGTKVRVILEVPQEFINEKRLTGKFRVGDSRWENKIRYITQIFMRPANPPMYKVDEIDVAYTKNQLQVVKANEKAPVKQKKYSTTKEIEDPDDDTEEDIVKIISKKKINNRIHYRILWSDKKRTYEARTELLKYIPDMIEEYEEKIKKKK
jgi:hypothetical protein